MAQKKAAKKTKMTKQGALKRAAKKARRAPKIPPTPPLLRGQFEPVKRLARNTGVPAGTLVEGSHGR